MMPLGRILPFALTAEPGLRGAMTGLWLAYFAGLRWLALVFAGTGLVFAAAGTTVLEAADPLRRARVLGSLGGVEHKAFIRVGGETIRGVPEDDQERSHSHEPERKKLQGPEERNAEEISQEKRGITQRSQKPSDIAHDKNKKNRNMDMVLAVLVREKERTDQDHAGACGTDEVREDSSGRQHQRIRPGRADKVACDADTA
jgi:hypothetical protein